jgi:hypothetical protein
MNPRERGRGDAKMTGMGSIRTIKKIWKSEPTIEGAGVHLKRAFGFHNPGQFDPFLLLDDFRSDNPADYVAGFPWHPHAASRRSHTSWTVMWSTKTASATAA